MTKTEHLFGHKKEHYFGITFPEVGYIRIADAKIVISKLYSRVNYTPTKQNKFQRYIQLRIRKIQDAISTWEKILEVEE